MKKPKKPTDDECIRRLHDAAKSLADEGATTWDIVTAFIDVALVLPERNPDYIYFELKQLAETFALGEGFARLKLQKLEASKKKRKRT